MRWVPAIKICFAVTMLSASGAGGSERLVEDLRSQLARHELRRQSLRELLGESRWQRLGEVRLELDLQEAGLSPPLAESPAKAKEIEGTLLHWPRSSLESSSCDASGSRIDGMGSGDGSAAVGGTPAG